ncbi:MAG: PadR family transcriptional regulator [Ruminococcaceae bacterium]|nr:PadR family transcriptional regulator [Oscillospiraceae bacterium]
MKISKELLKGSTSLMVLKVIAQRDMYGYQIIGEIAARSNETFKLNEGTLYPILHALEKEGVLTSYRGESEIGRERKYYKITTAGKLQLTARMEEWAAFTDAVNGVLREGC